MVASILDDQGGSCIPVSEAFHGMDVRIGAAIPHAFTSTGWSAKLQREGCHLPANCLHLSACCLWALVISLYWLDKACKTVLSLGT